MLTTLEYAYIYMKYERVDIRILYGWMNAGDCLYKSDAKN